MKKIFYIASSILMLASCGSKEKAPEVISFEELAGETGSEQTAPASANESANANAPLSTFIRGQLGSYDTTNHVAPHTLDRFGYSTAVKTKFLDKASGGVGANVPSATFCYYTFSDSLKTKNAFYNWLDCFGTDCASIQLNKNFEGLESNPSITLVYDTVIVAVEFGAQDPKDYWKPFQDSLFGQFGKSYNYRLDVTRKGTAEWK